MRQYLIALFFGLMIANVADALLYGSANIITPAKIAGTNAVDVFNYQLSLLLRKLP
jgi:hypothetical protein